MKKTVVNIFNFVLVALLMAGSVSAVNAAPRLTLNPVTGSYTNGSEFKITIGVNSDSEKSSAVDVWASFDKSRLEIISITKADNPPFDYDMTPKFDNTAGTFQFSCASSNPSAYDDTTIVGDLAVITFRAKATGTAALNFTCTAGSTVDSNIFDSDISDKISCSANSVGSYTITESSSSTTTATSTPTSTVTPTGSTKTTTTLPQTGAVGSTVGLIIFGAISLASALFLKFL